MIDFIEIENWKVIEKFRTVFPQGITFLCGRNASGKTSVLEAICLCITGDTLTVEDPRGLVRSGATEPACIRLGIRESDQRRFTVERVLSKERKIRASVVDNKGKMLANGWRQTTEFLEREFAIARPFFKRIVYMSEGDVFRFVDSPPETSIMQHIQRILGLEALQELKTAAEELQKEYLAEEARLRSIDAALAEIPKRDQKAVFQLEEEVQSFLKKEEYLKQVLREATEKLRILSDMREQKRSLLSETRQLSQQMRPLTKLLQPDLARLAYDTLKDWRNRTETHEQEEETTRNRLTEFETEIALLERQLSELRATGVKERRCPVCRSRLSEENLASAIDRFRKDIEGVHRKRDRLAKRWKNATSELAKNRQKLEDATRIAARIESVQQRTGSNQLVLEEIEGRTKQLNREIEALGGKTASTEGELQHIQNDINRTQLDAMRLRTGISHEDIQNLDSQLASCSKSILILEVLTNTVVRLTRAQRQVRLGKVYEEISLEWNRFLEREGYEVRLDDRTVPYLERDGARYDFSFLSGGEKTALLVMVRTALSRYFSNVGFMMLDEPLEHLDSLNRRLLVDFLVQSFRRKGVEQLVVTTFEETLLRKFFDDKSVNIVFLPREK